MTTEPRHTTNSETSQMVLPFDNNFGASDQVALWTPRDIWVKLNKDIISSFKEDRRLDFKVATRIDFEDLSTYLSAFSNTPDGGLLVYGVDNSGQISGCSKLSVDQLNRIESCHTTMCPMAKPEFKSF